MPGTNAPNETAWSVAPDPWMRHMRRGEWQRAWEFSDGQLAARAARSCTHLPRHLQYVWTGAPLQGKRVLVRCYHGLGDTIQFIRYAPLLKAIAAEVIVWAQPKLLPLLRRMEGIDRLMPLHEGVPDVAYDVDVEVMELPHVFRTTLADIPGSIPYLHVEPMPLPWSEDRPVIGLVWKSGDWNQARSIPYALLAPFAQLAGVRIVILQPDAIAAGWNGEFGWHPGELDLLEHAQAIRALDLLVTIDSMPAHVAGALGVPVWTLLHTEADWRWMDRRNDSPWYPAMRLFRQRRPGDWSRVIDEVITQLQPCRDRRPALHGAHRGFNATPGA
jgi:hypothetical protein